MATQNTTQHSTDKLLNEIAAAEMLGLSPSWLRQHRCKGTGPKFIKMGRAVRYRVSDLAAYVESRSVGVGHDAA